MSEPIPQGVHTLRPLVALAALTLVCLLGARDYRMHRRVRRVEQHAEVAELLATEAHTRQDVLTAAIRYSDPHRDRARRHLHAVPATVGGQP